MEQTKLLFSLLRSAMTGEASGVEKGSISLSRAQVLLGVTRTLDIASFVALAMEREELLAPDAAPLARAFKEQQFLALYRYERTQYAQEQICALLAAEQIDFLPLKGAVLRDLYDKPWLRTSCDIDILVHEADVERAIALLCERLEYQQKGERHFHDYSLFSPDGIHLELHFSILEKTEQLDGLLCRVWEFAHPCEEGSCRYVMTPEYQLFHVVAHMAYHFKNGGCGVKPFLDLWLLQKEDNFDKEKLQKFIEECNLDKFYQYACDLIAVWFGDKERTPLLIEMERYLLQGGQCGSIQNFIALKRVENGSRGYWRRRIFLPLSLMRKKYPVLERHAWLLPFCWVCRIFRVLFHGGVRRLKKEATALHANSQSQVKSLAELMETMQL